MKWLAAQDSIYTMKTKSPDDIANELRKTKRELRTLKKLVKHYSTLLYDSKLLADATTVAWGKAAEAEKDYWKNRCLSAERSILSWNTSQTMSKLHSTITG